MLRSLFFFIFIVIIIEIDCTIRVGYIHNAKYVSNDITIIITYTNICDECICSGFFFSLPSFYVGLNCCYKSSKTCELFANYSTPSMMTMNLNSIFIFIQQPPVQNITMVTTTTTTTTITTKATTTPLCSLGATLSDPCHGNPPTLKYIYTDGMAHCRVNATGYLAKSYTFQCHLNVTCYADSDCGQDGFCDQWCVSNTCGDSNCNQHSGNCGKLATGLNCGVAYSP